MKIAIAALAVLAGLFFASPAKAQKSVTTADMLDDCKAEMRILSFIDAKGDTSHFSADEWFEGGECLGFVMGVANANVGLSFVSDGVVSTMQTPKGYTGRQVVEAFISYADVHPETMKENAENTVVAALGTAGILVKTDIGVLAPLNSTPKQSTPKPSVPAGHSAA